MQPGQLRKKGVIISDALAVGVQHDMPDIALFRFLHHLDDLWMNRWLSPRELDHFWIALCLYQVIQNALNFFECQVEARTSIGETERAIHITGAVHFNNAQAGVLLVIRAKATVVRTPPVYFRGIGQRDGAWLVETGSGGICLSITIDQPFKQAVFRTTLAHIHFIVA